jgi:hypothetical protein
MEKITVNFSCDKLQALRILSPDTYDSIEKMLQDYLEKIYMKTVPQSTRLYIEGVIKEESSVAVKGGKSM